MGVALGREAINSSHLLKRAREGDKEAINQVAEDNFGLVYSVVRHFLNRGYEKEDLFQIGCLGLTKAILRFDPSFETAFSTYAVPMITGEIKRFLRDDGMVKVSRRLKEIGQKAYAIMEKHRMKTGEELKLSQMAAMLQVEQEELILAMDSLAPTYSLSGGVDHGEDDFLCLEERVGSTGMEEETVQRLLLKDLLSKLSCEEQKLVSLRYFKNKTQSEVAALFHISQVQVSRRERKILEKLRGFL